MEPRGGKRNRDAGPISEVGSNWEGVAGKSVDRGHKDLL
jgi:hypothetical protein